MRLAVAPPDAWWVVEASVSGEQLVAPTVHGRVDGTAPQGREVLMVSGPRLRADAGMRARFGAPWSATAYAGIGLQMHHRDIEKPSAAEPKPTGDMPLGGVLALGMGLEYRAGALLLGLELHLRQGVPADYRSMEALLSVGFFLNQGE